MNPRPKAAGKGRARRPLVIVAELTSLLIARGLYFTLGGKPSGVAGALVAELRRSLREEKGRP